MKGRIFQAREGSVAVPIFPIAENRKLRHRRLNIEFKVQIKRVGGIKTQCFYFTTYKTKCLRVSIPEIFFGVLVACICHFFPTHALISSRISCLTWLELIKYQSLGDFFFARNTCSRQRPILHQRMFLQTWNLCPVLFDGAHSSIKVPSKGNIFLSSGSGSLLKWSFIFFIIIFELI